MTERKKHIFDESNGLWYELNGDYYTPILTLSSEEQRPIGKSLVNLRLKHKKCLKTGLTRRYETFHHAR